MKSNSITTGPITPMLIKLSVPIFIGMMINLIYNVTDTFWLSQIDLDDPGVVGGTGLIFPIIFMSIALSNGMQTGVSSLTARTIGSEKIDNVNSILNTSLFLSIILTIAVIIPSILLSSEIITILGGTGTYYTHGLTYFINIIPAAGAMFFIATINGILQGSGDMKPVMFAMVIGTVFNIILDPIFIFPLQMGVQGAAIATVLSQFVVLFFSIKFIREKRTLFSLSIKPQTINFQTLKDILKIGIPQTLSLSLMSLSIIIMNRLIVSIDTDAMTAFSICGKFDSLQFTPILAISAAMVTAIGQNYGKKNFDRIKKIWHKGLLIAGIIEVSLALFLIIFSPLIYKHLSNVQAVIDYAVKQTRTVNIFYTAAVFGILARSVFQAMNNPLPALFLTMLRLILVTIPLSFVFSKMLNLGVSGVWYGMISGSIIAGTASFIWTENTINKQLKK